MLEETQKGPTFAVLTGLEIPDGEQRKPFFHYTNDLGMRERLVFLGEWVIVPQILGREMLLKISSTHLGGSACLARAKATIFWPEG